MKRMKWLALLAVVALLAPSTIGCNQSSPSSQQGQTPQPTVAQPSATQPTTVQQPPTQPAQQPTAAQAAPQPTAEEELEVVAPEMADNITSYRQTLKMLTTVDEESDTDWNSLTEWVKSIPARRMLIKGADSDGEPFEWEMIQIGDASYMRYGEEWMVMAGGQEPPGNESLAWVDPNTWKDDPACSYKGQEAINGMQTKHWHCGKEVFTRVGMTPFTDGQLDEGSVDSWVSTEFEVAVKTEIEWKGKNEEDKPVTFLMTSETYDINESFTIEAPEGVDLPGLPDDIPMMEGANDVFAMAQMVTYNVVGTVQDVTDFYTASMPDNGWEAGEEGFVPGMLSFTKGERSAQIMISEEDATTASVMIMLQGE